MQRFPGWNREWSTSSWSSTGTGTDWGMSALLWTQPQIVVSIVFERWETDGGWEFDFWSKTQVHTYIHIACVHVYTSDVGIVWYGNYLLRVCNSTVQKWEKQNNIDIWSCGKYQLSHYVLVISFFLLCYDSNASLQSVLFELRYSISVSVVISPWWFACTPFQNCVASCPYVCFTMLPLTCLLSFFWSVCPL